MIALLPPMANPALVLHRAGICFAPLDAHRFCERTSKVP
jgi:hypothetical protein